MIRTLKIDGRTGTFDIPSFLLSENEHLTIRIVITGEIYVGKYRLIVKHGDDKRTISLKNFPEITLPAEWLNKSSENLEFSLVLLDVDETKVIKDDYNIEPLKIEKIGGNFAFTAQVQEFEKRQAEFDKKLVELYEKLSQFEREGVELMPVDEE